MGSEDANMPRMDLIRSKVYFYTEDDDLKSRMFPDSWYHAMSNEIAEEISSDEQPFFEVSRIGMNAKLRMCSLKLLITA